MSNEGLLGNDSWYKNLKKSKLNPPSWVFGVVWPILYSTMIIYLVIMIRSYDNSHKLPLIFFSVQLFFNLIWTTIFFKYKRFKLALLDLLLTLGFTIATIVSTFRLNLTASLILIPYVLWLFLATYLNSYIVVKN